ncbi:hypothetical protein [Streptococcus equinus]|uniref:hypothetical protein n=1 Tax=Streptococcus equinus TaxID=1335 RepID=UPI0012FAED8B|nr:hypothetical protein [Streptococcus equinus]
MTSTRDFDIQLQHSATSPDICADFSAPPLSVTNGLQDTSECFYFNRFGQLTQMV